MIRLQNAPHSSLPIRAEMRPQQLDPEELFRLPPLQWCGDHAAFEVGGLQSIRKLGGGRDDSGFRQSWRVSRSHRNFRSSRLPRRSDS